MNDRQAICLTFGACLLLSYITILWRVGDTAHLVMSGLFALGIWEIQTRKTDSYILRTRQPDSLIGIVLAVSLCLIGFKTYNFVLIRLMPFLGGIGFLLFAFNRQGLKIYIKEIVLLFFLGVPSVIALFLPDLSGLTAMFSGVLLNFTGLEILSIENNKFILASKVIQVFRGCSGIEYMTYLLGLCSLCLTLFPISGAKRYFIIICSQLLGFTVNCFRVSLLVILVNNDRQAEFYYWHEGNGSLIFGGVSVIMLGLLYSSMIRLEYDSRGNYFPNFIKIFFANIWFSVSQEAQFRRTENENSRLDLTSNSKVK